MCILLHGPFLIGYMEVRRDSGDCVDAEGRREKKHSSWALKFWETKRTSLWPAVGEAGRSNTFSKRRKQDHPGKGQPHRHGICLELGGIRIMLCIEELNKQCLVSS